MLALGVWLLLVSGSAADQSLLHVDPPEEEQVFAFDFRPEFKSYPYHNKLIISTFKAAEIITGEIVSALDGLETSVFCWVDT